MKKLPIIRHIRYFYLSYKFNKWWFHYGSLLGSFPNESDLEYLKGVWKGKY